MDNKVVMGNAADYATKMDNTLTDAVQAWWKGLSKKDLLHYISEQPDITADHIRNMLANEQCNLLFGVAFSLATLDAAADFNTAK